MQAIHILLFILYGCLLSAGVRYLPFFTKSGIRPSFLLLFFWLRILAGVVHNFAAWKYYPNHGDVWSYFSESLELKYYLLHNPQHFLDSHILGGSLAPIGEPNSFWGFLSYKLLFDMNVLFNFLSFDNLYINTLLFAFPVYMSSLLLYRLFSQQFPGSQLAALTALVIPSTLYWTACIHKEGFLFFFLGLLLWNWQQMLTSATLKNGFLCALLLCCVFLFRNTLVFCLLPGLLLWTLAQKTTIPPKRLLLVTIAVIAGLVAISAMAGDRYNVFAIISQRQHQFDSMQGGSRIYFPTLYPHFTSFVQAFPYALLNGFLQPLPGAGGRLIYTCFFIEMALVWTLVLTTCSRYLRRKPTPTLPAFTFFCLALAIIGLLQTGYTIPFAGSIIRYRSLFLPFLLAPFLYSLRPQKPFQRADQWLQDHLLVRPS
jgi:hypothetical protein